MDYRKTKETLREGRFALNELEKLLKNKQSNRAPSAPPIRTNDNFVNRISYNPKNYEKHKYASERQNLDKNSRTTRLSHRKNAPLGSLEELDDRGLIVGGSIPSVYSSSPFRQRARRQQEMKNRSSRLQEREDNVR